VTVVAGICCYCGCSETNPCMYGCAWTDDTRTLCSACSDARDTARVLVEAAGVAIQLPLKLVTTSFDALPLERQAALVKVARELVDGMRDGIALAMNEEAVAAVRDLDRLTGFVLEHVPEAEIGAEDTAVDVAIRLLQPHVGSRIVVPGGV
jgi:hypothetical protein